jgi:hypothetical protein
VAGDRSRCEVRKDVRGWLLCAGKYREQASQFQGIPFSADVGIVLVDSKLLRQALLPSPSRCLSAIQAVLPVLMKRMSDTLLDDVVKRLAVLASHPTDVEPFVNKVSMMEVSVWPSRFSLAAWVCSLQCSPFTRPAPALSASSVHLEAYSNHQGRGQRGEGYGVSHGRQWLGGARHAESDVHDVEGRYAPVATRRACTPYPVCSSGKLPCVLCVFACVYPTAAPFPNFASG